MGAHEKIKTEKLGEAVIQSYDEDIEIVIVQYKQSYKGVSRYIVTSDLVCDGTYYDVLAHYETYNRKESDRYFFMLKRRYPGKRIRSKIF